MRGATLLGHRIHPILIVFPLGLLGASVVFDIVRLVNHNPEFATVTYRTLTAGLVGGLLAAIFGVVDLISIPDGTRAKRVGLAHGSSMLLAVILFALSWSMRRADPLYLPTGGALACSFAGLVVALFGGWLGGELVERLGVGVYPDAELNAPSSLSHEAGAVRPGPTTR